MKEIYSETITNGPITSLEFDGRILHVLCENGTLNLRYVPEEFPSNPAEFWATASNRRTFDFNSTKDRKLEVAKILPPYDNGDLSKSHTVALGGENRELELWKSTESGYEKVWTAKNVKSDSLGMIVPVHVKAIEFIPSGTASEHDTASDKAVNYRVVIATKYSHIRVYDTTKSRRPVINHTIPGKKQIVQLRIIPSSSPSNFEKLDFRVIYSDTTGHCSEFDIAKGKDCGLYAGPTGEVRGVTLFGENMEMVATVGFDRYLRVYDKRKQVSKVYWQGAGKGVAVVDGEDDEVEEKKEVKEGEEEDEEDVWDEMEEADDEGDARKKKRSRESGSEKGKKRTKLK